MCMLKLLLSASISASQGNVMLHVVHIAHTASNTGGLTSFGHTCRHFFSLNMCHCPAAIPSLVVAAASFDDMIAITGYTIFIDIAVRRPTGNQVWQIMHGPVSVVLGVLAGLLAAFLCSFTKLWNNNVKRVCVVLFAGVQHSAAHTLSCSFFCHLVST